MAEGTRTIKIRIDGDTSGLRRAAATSVRTVRNLKEKVDDAGGSLGTRLGSSLGQRFAGILPDAVGSAFSALPPQVQGAVAIAGIAIAGILAPLMGAAVTAGILLGVGGGALAAGIIAASKDPAVQKAWDGFGKRAKRAISGFVAPFRGPLIRAADTFGDAIERMSPAFTRIGQATAPIVDKLAPALATMAETAMPGIESAIKASAPLFDELAEHAPQIGQAVSQFFTAIAAGAPGAALALGHLLDVIEFAIGNVGAALAGMSIAYKAIVDGITWAAQWVSRTWDRTVNGINSGMTRAYNWVTSKWNQLVGFIAGLPGRIGRATSGMWDGIKHAFRSAINWVIARWNRLSFRIPGFSAFGLRVPGFSLSTPDIGFLARGGPALAGRTYVVGERGPELLTMGSQSGYVTPNHALGPPNVTVVIDGRALDDSLMRVVHRRAADVARAVAGGNRLNARLA